MRCRRWGLGSAGAALIVAVLLFVLTRLGKPFEAPPPPLQSPESMARGGGDWRALNAQGKTWAWIGDFEGALKLFESAHALQPTSAEVLNNRGGAKLGLRDARGAYEDFSCAVAISPRYAEAWINRAQACVDLGRWEEAVSDYDRGLQLLGASDALRGQVLSRRQFIQGRIQARTLPGREF